MKNQTQKQIILTMLLSDNLVTQSSVAKKTRNSNVQVRTRISDLNKDGIKTKSFKAAKNGVTSTYYELTKQPSNKLIKTILK
jgi:predicted ArsR family transcriptional regulator